MNSWLPTSQSRLRRLLAGFAIPLLLCLVAPGASADDQTVDPDTEQAIDDTLKVAQIALAGTTDINDDERLVLKDLMVCNVNGQTVEGCGKKALWTN